MADETHEVLWDLPSTDLWQRERLGLCELVLTAPPGFALPEGKTIAISVIGGSSKGLTRRLVSHTSALAGRVVARISMHCAVSVEENTIRPCDLDSHTGTYVENQRVSAAPLEHFSEFRMGSSVPLPTVLAPQAVATVDHRDQFEAGGE